MKIGIAAIFKNECPYIIEWIAYHRLIGVNHFFIADNVSDDGTSELLQTLDNLGIITRLHHPRIGDKGPQAPAYNKILKQFGDQVDVLGFIDADEFIVVDENTSLQETLHAFGENPSYGALALNWRIFGSSHHRLMPNGLVTENYRLRAPDDFKFNNHIKSFVKPSMVSEMFIHHCKLKQGKYATTAFQPAVFDDSQARTLTCDFSKLFINHYVVKSRMEHFVNKAKKGSAAGSAKRAKGHSYYFGHDINTLEDQSFSSALMVELKSEVDALTRRINTESIFMRFKKAHVEIIDNVLTGWVSLNANEMATIRVVYGNDEILIECNRQRPDVLRKGFTKNPVCGFRRAFSRPITPQSIQAYLYGSTQQFEVHG